MVGADRVVNAVSLNSVLIHSARLVGPAIAGILIALAGVAPCFAINALSFGGMIYALWLMEPAQLNTAPRAERERGAIRAAVRYVRQTPELAVPLGLMALVGTFGLNFQVILPLLARFSFDGGAGVYATLVAAMGAGSVIGALATGAHGRTDARLITGAALSFGVLAGLAAVMPSIALEVPMVALLGALRRHLRRRDQLIAAACGRARDAGPGDGPLLGRLPRLDPDRRTARRLALGSL